MSIKKILKKTIVGIMIMVSTICMILTMVGVYDRFINTQPALVKHCVANNTQPVMFVHNMEYVYGCIDPEYNIIIIVDKNKIME